MDTPLEARIKAVLKGLRKPKDEGGLKIAAFEKLPDRAAHRAFFDRFPTAIAFDTIKVSLTGSFPFPLVLSPLTQRNRTEKIEAKEVYVARVVDGRSQQHVQQFQGLPRDRVNRLHGRRGAAGPFFLPSLFPPPPGGRAGTTGLARPDRMKGC